MVDLHRPGVIVTLTLQVFACDSFDGFPDDDHTAVTKTSYFEVRSLEQKPTPISISAGVFDVITYVYIHISYLLTVRCIIDTIYIYT